MHEIQVLIQYNRYIVCIVNILMYLSPLVSIGVPQHGISLQCTYSDQDLSRDLVAHITWIQIIGFGITWDWVMNQAALGFLVPSGLIRFWDVHQS